jgi:ABC-2 type transport system permease protein
MRRVGLIAGREIAAYAGVPSFWVALFMGPVLMLLTGLAAQAVIPHPTAPSPRHIAVVAEDPVLAHAAEMALRAGGKLEGRAVVLQPTPAPGAVRIETDTTGRVSVQLTGEALPQSTIAVLSHDLDVAARGERLRQAGATPAILAVAESSRVVVQEPPPPAPAPADTGRTGRFAVMMLLWMTLIGALGMLLQAIVRERTNRALESLLASARAHEIIFGKLIGVGALSLLVLGVWLGAGAAMAASPLRSLGGGLPAILLGAFADPLALLRAGAIYVLSFAMYGTALIGLGAVARDVPSAQNLSRPVFGVLLLVFFVGLADFAGTGAGLHWLAWVPLFTPFVTLMAPPGAIGAAQMGIGFVGMMVATAAFAWLATRAMMSDGARPRRIWVERTHDRRAAA